MSRRCYHEKPVLLSQFHRIPEEYVILGKGGRVSYWLLKRLESWVMRKASAQASKTL